LAVTAFIASAATMGFAFVTGDRYLLGGLLFLIANISGGASIVVYNSFLPQLAGPDERDKVSSRGWALGYLGGGLLLAFNLVLFLNADGFGLSEADAVRICFLSVAAWWAAFTVI